MKNEIVTIGGLDVYLNFDFIDILAGNDNKVITKTVCFFNFKKPNSLYIGEMIRENNRVKIFDSELDAKKYAMQYIEQRLLHI